ncbi:MAG: proliferating cell nuclear antigen (pcna) [Candidatus Nanohaloarchaeota archaeon QJJ-7]|nr:proliferating cell nuclear antigen (pcna) [Candidatus Nanohaloarchaeota archaeon QJJ-7]
MLKAELSDADLLQDSLQSISNIITEGVFQFSDSGLKLVAADPAMVAMVDFELEADAFDSYECGDEEKVGVNIEDLYSIVRRAGSKDSVVLELDEEESKLRVKMENGSERSFSLALLNLSEEDIPSTDDLEFSVSADITTSVLDDAVGDASVIGDSVTVKASPESIVLEAEGDNSNVETTIQQGSEGMMELDAEGEVQSMFSLDYLNKMMKAKKLSDSLAVKIGDDFPMRLEFQVPEKVQLSYILAPRIEE